MAEMNLKQIIDRLNAEFTGDTRKLVFWYDDNGEFVEDMQNVALDNAKVYFLQPDNQFATKLFLERQDTTTNYLLYAPFPKPDVRDNHLEDTLLYSKRFFADRASLLSVDLGIDEKYKPIIEKHIKFFASKERTQRFYDLEIENFNEENIITGLLSAICRTRTCSFEEVIRVMLTDSTLEDNKFLMETEKYGLLGDFWKLCEQHFGYTDVKPTLDKLVVTMFVTYTAKYVPSELPKPWKAFLSYKAGNIIAFMDNLMNNILYRSRYDELSAHVATGLNAQSVFSDYPPEDLVGCDTFAVIDQILIKWLVERLVAEDTGAKLDELTIPQLCEKRCKMHFGAKAESRYQMLSSAYQLIQAGNYHCSDNFKDILRQYQETDSGLDYEYRRFYSAYDQIDDTTVFEPLRDLVENIYTNEYPYDEHSMIYYCDDLPHPTKEHEAFIEQGVQRLLEVLDISGGKALVLFTAKTDMEAVYSILSQKELSYKILMQQPGSSQDQVLNEFKENTNSVLLGTGAYWEGISIEGKSLSNVVIFRLPFPVPDPIINYKASIAKDALMDVNVPEMVIKLKQGIGRLIRNFTDTGIVCIIDPRLRDDPAERYHDIAWTSLPIKNRTKSLDMLRKFYESLPAAHNETEG